MEVLKAMKGKKEIEKKEERAHPAQKQKEKTFSISDGRTVTGSSVSIQKKKLERKEKKKTKKKKEVKKTQLKK